MRKKIIIKGANGRYYTGTYRNDFGVKIPMKLTSSILKLKSKNVLKVNVMKNIHLSSVTKL